MEEFHIQDIFTKKNLILKFSSLKLLMRARSKYNTG